MSPRTTPSERPGRRWWTVLSVAIVVAALREIAFARNASRSSSPTAPPSAPSTAKPPVADGSNPT